MFSVLTSNCMGQETNITLEVVRVLLTRLKCASLR